MSNPIHGSKATLILAIAMVATKLIENGKNVGKLYVETETSEQNPQGIWTFSPKDLDRLARNVGATSASMLANAVAEGNAYGSDSTLQVELEYCEAGKPIGFQADGVTPITNSKGSTTFETSHWRTVETSITVGEDAASYISTINKELDLEDARENRAALKKATRDAEKAKRFAKTVTVPIAETTPAETSGSTEATETF